MLATRDQRFEELALDRVGEPEEHEAAGVSVDLQLRVDLERDRRTGRAVDFVRDARRQHDVVGRAAGVDAHDLAVALEQRPGDARKHRWA